MPIKECRFAVLEQHQQEYMSGASVCYMWDVDVATTWCQRSIEIAEQAVCLKLELQVMEHNCANLFNWDHMHIKQCRLAVFEQHQQEYMTCASLLNKLCVPSLSCRWWNIPVQTYENDETGRPWCKQITWGSWKECWSCCCAWDTATPAKAQHVLLEKGEMGEMKGTKEENEGNKGGNWRGKQQKKTKEVVRWCSIYNADTSGYTNLLLLHPFTQLPCARSMWISNDLANWSCLQHQTSIACTATRPADAAAVMIRVRNNHVGLYLYRCQEIVPEDHCAYHLWAREYTQHSTAQHSTAQHSTAQQAQHSTAQHGTAQHELLVGNSVYLGHFLGVNSSFGCIQAQQHHKQDGCQNCNHLHTHRQLMNAATLHVWYCHAQPVNPKHYIA